MPHTLGCLSLSCLASRHGLRDAQCIFPSFLEAQSLRLVCEDRAYFSRKISWNPDGWSILYVLG